jgi:hypothetical protein
MRESRALEWQPDMAGNEKFKRSEDALTRHCANVTGFSTHIGGGR